MEKGESGFIDLKKAAEGLALDTGTMVELIRDFIETEDEFLAPLRQDLVSANFGRLKKDAHKLKGTAYNLRVELIAKQAERLEKYAVDKDLSSCRDQVAEIEESFEGIEKELETLEGRGG